jgi:iron complex transport system substrate-binding protein
MNGIPQRIVCLSAEAADWLWRIGAWEQVVGITAFFTPPPGASPKPRISTFSTARLDEISELEPDLIITFSDVQTLLAAELMHRGFTVLATNQRTLAETEATLAGLARMTGCEREAEPWLQQFRERLAPVEESGDRPRVYFEEWNDPLISGIAWVSELIERAGGDDIFAALRSRRSAPERVVSPERVCAADPEVILASWCGRPVQKAEIAARPGWSELTAVRAGRVHEIAGEDILQPGFRLVYGYKQIKEYLRARAPRERAGVATAAGKPG